MNLDIISFIFTFVPMDEQYYISRLEKKNVKPTALRLLILRTMMSAPFAVSLSDLNEMLGTVDKSTIFRTLTLFLGQHVIHAIEDGSGSLKYEVCSNECSCTINDMHTHFYCERCHRTFCFKNIQIPVIDLPEGFTMQSINYMVKGICANCILEEKNIIK